MLRSLMQRVGVLLVLGMGGIFALRTYADSATKPAPLRLGKNSCVREPKRERRPRSTMCHIGNTFMLRFADSAGVGEGLHPSGPKLVAIGVTRCQPLMRRGAHAAPTTCTLGTQQYVLDSAGVGEGSLGSATSDSAGVGEGSLVLDASDCKWVLDMSYKPYPVLQCTFGMLTIRLDSAGVGEGRVSTR